MNTNTPIIEMDVTLNEHTPSINSLRQPYPHALPNQKVALPTLEGIVFIKIKDIIRLEADHSYTLLYLAGGKKLLVSKPLKEFERKLKCPPFYRTHQSHIVNLQWAVKYIKGKGGYLVLEDGSTVDVSARRKTGFIKALNNYFY